jgi:predicted pyridoxine 5'-phosphate oxidase superfamily flavin-nucleotide-binding protein
MVITEEIKKLVAQAPLVPIVTVSSQGEPHLIVVGKVQEIREDDVLAFGIYKMHTTRKNIEDTGKMQVVIASLEGGPRGFRLTGKACLEEPLVLFKAETAAALL